jgi:glutamyl-tRNA reductase
VTLSSSSSLDQIRVRFATFRDRSIDERAAVARSLASVAAEEHVLLETCHRVELVTVEPAEGVPIDGGQENAATAGRDAVRRVFEVVAGFDSAVVAEEQLLGQARGAYEAALADHSTGPILNELFRRALRFGRRVRSHAMPGADRSLADRGSAWLLERLESPARVLVAGTGEMGRLVAARLATAGHTISVVSRSAERGGRMLEELPGDAHRLLVGGTSVTTTADHAAVVLAVRVRQPILSARALPDSALPWTLDLSTPPAVARDAVDLLGTRLLTLDRLGEIAGATHVLEPRVERRLRRELAAEVDRFVAWLETRGSHDALAVLHGEADAVRRRHLERLRRHARLAPEQLAAVDAAAAAMVGDLLHGPTVELRRGGADADTVRRLFGLDG